MWFIGVEVEQETSAPPPKKNPGSAPVSVIVKIIHVCNENNLFTFRISCSCNESQNRIAIFH